MSREDIEALERCGNYALGCFYLIIIAASLAAVYLFYTWVTC